MRKIGINSKAFKRMAYLSRTADAYYKIWCEATDKGLPDSARAAKQQLLEIIPELDRIGNVNHFYKGINY